MNQIRTLIAELHVVGAGELQRRGRAIRVVELLERRRGAEPTIGEVRDRRVGDPVCDLFLDGNLVRIGTVGHLPAPFAREPRNPGLEQEAVRNRRAVIALEDPLTVVPVAGRLG